MGLDLHTCIQWSSFFKQREQELMYSVAWQSNCDKQISSHEKGGGDRGVSKGSRW